MDEVLIYLSKKKVIKIVGYGYKDVLATLKKQGSLLDYQDAIELRFDKDKALHIQAVLEFYEVKQASTNFIKPLHQTKKDEE